MTTQIFMRGLALLLCGALTLPNAAFALRPRLEETSPGVSTLRQQQDHLSGLEEALLENPSHQPTLERTGLEEDTYDEYAALLDRHQAYVLVLLVTRVMQNRHSPKGVGSTWYLEGGRFARVVIPS